MKNSPKTYKINLHESIKIVDTVSVKRIIEYYEENPVARDSITLLGAFPIVYGLFAGEITMTMFIISVVAIPLSSHLNSKTTKVRETI